MTSQIKTLSVIDFGASVQAADNAAAINAAISACSADGGGRVEVPAGTFRTGSIRLLDKVELHLSKDANLIGSTDPAAYHAVLKKPLRTCPEDARNRYPKKATVLVWAQDCHNVAITGSGRIIGPDPVADAREALKPSLVSLINCQGIRISGIRIENSTFWSLHLLNSRDIVVEDCHVETPLDRINGDGIDPDGCVNVRISRCHVATGDDAICIKTSEGPDAENILIEDCVLKSGCATALKVGTESIGNISGVRIQRCRIENSHWGLMIYAKDGGAFRDIKVTDCCFTTWGRISLLADITPRFYKEPVFGSIEGLNIRNCRFTGPGKVLLEGKPDYPIRNVMIASTHFDSSGTAPENEVRKPNGAGLVDVDPKAENHALSPHLITAVHTQNPIFSEITSSGHKENELVDIINSKETP
jgi:polygalacturonase